QVREPTTGLQLGLQLVAVRCGPGRTGQGCWSSLNDSERPRPELLMRPSVGGQPALPRLCGRRHADDVRLVFALAVLACAMLSACSGVSTSSTNQAASSSPSQSPATSSHVTGPPGSPGNPL